MVTSSVAKVVSDVAVGRQAIVDTTGAVVAYELLFRRVESSPEQVSGDQMTASVVLGALALGPERLADGSLLFCNADREVLTGAYAISLPPGSTVIEVLEHVEIDDDIVAGCQRLVDQGFRLALDDLVWRDGVERLLPLASYVKVDFLLLDRPAIVELVARCSESQRSESQRSESQRSESQGSGHPLELLAEKVETEDDIAWATEHGFTLFQGYAIERPSLIRGKTIAPGAASQLRLAATVLSEELDMAAVEQVVAGEPGLLLQVLHLASSGADHGVRRSLRTIREALVLLGTTRVRGWIGLLLLTHHSEVSRPSLVRVLTRAKMCELLAEQRSMTVTVSPYVVGMLSGLDLLLGRPLEELMELLEIEQPLVAAAALREGELGALVTEVIDYEHALVGAAPVAPELDAVAAEAFAWATELESLLPS